MAEAAAPAPAWEGPAMRVVVSDPARQGEGMSAHITYKITTQFLRPVEGVSGSCMVVRRFSDFVWLRTRLREALPHVFVPCLPEKQALGRLNNEFVEMRHRALSRWIERVTSHPEMGVDSSLVAFVSMGAESFAARRDAARGEGVREGVKEGAGKIFKFLRSTATTVAAAAASVSGASAPVSAQTKGKSAEDLSFEELEAYVYGQTPLLTCVYSEAATLAGRYRESASACLEYGAALRSLAVCEGGHVGESLSAAGLAVWAASTAAYEQAAEETELVVERLADLVRNTRGVKEAMEERAQASAALGEALAQVEKLRATITVLSTNPTPANAEKKVQVEAALTQAQTAATEARAYYDTVASAIIREIEALRVTLNADIRSILLDYASIQTRNEQKIAAAWERVQAPAALALTQETAASGSAAVRSL